MNSRIQTLAKAIKEHPEDSYYKFTLALEMLKLNEAGKARVLFETIVKSDPEYVGVYYHLAKLYVGLGENKRALDTYKEGIKIAEKQHNNHAKSELVAALLELESEMEDQT